MREAGIGRVLVASIHQGIADILPMRLGFYENWLNAEGLRYGRITTRAGEYAAEWTVESMAPMLRGAIKAAPAWLRQRLLLLLASHLVRDSCRRSRIVAKVRGGTARIDLRESVFCSVREPVGQPLCGFYAAAFTRLLTLFNLSTRAEVIACRGIGEPSCVFRIALPDGAPQADPGASAG